MKSNRLFAFVTAFAIVAIGFVGLNGCKKKEGTPGGGVKSSVTTSAEKTCFAEVASHLDAGGNLYLYLSTEQWLEGLSEKISDWRKMMEAIPDIKSDERRTLDKVFDIAKSLTKDSGLEDVSGVGISSIATAPGLYRTKLIVHHYPGRGGGFLWTMFGKKPHPLEGLDLLPANTVAASFADCDFAALWSVIEKTVAGANLPQADQWLQQVPGNFQKFTGLNWQTVLDSLGGEYGVVITLDDSKKITIPLPNQEPLEIPEPGLMVVVKVKDDTIFNRVDRALQDARQQIVRVDKPDLKMRTVVVPLPIPVQLRPTLASSGGYLILATSDAMVQEALAVKAGQKPGLKSSDEFKRLAKDLPQEGNQFNFMSESFGRAVAQIQQQAIVANPRTPQSQKDLFRSFFQPEHAAFSYSVAGHNEDGWVAVGNGNQHAGKLLATVGVIVPVAVLAAIALPNFAKARQTAQKNACINNLRQINGAKQQWALENRKTGANTPSQDDLLLYLRTRTFPTCPAGGVYRIRTVDETPTCSIPGHAVGY